MTYTLSSLSRSELIQQGNKSIMVRRSQPARRIQNVRVVDSDSSQDSTFVDSAISKIKRTESQIRLLCGDNVFVDNAASPVTGTLGFDNIFSTDDFNSIAAQFNEFRVRAIKYDVYDLNQSNVGGAMFSTFHDVYQNAVNAYTFAQVVDGPDAKTVPPGTGKVSFYWVARGSHEMDFQSTATGTFPAVIDRMGGLRYALNSSATPGAKFQVVTHALVDFRGRR